MSEPVYIPEWIVNLVGRLTLENEALRRDLALQTQSKPPAAEAEQDGV